MRANSAPNSIWKALIAAVIAVGLLVCYAPNDAQAATNSKATSAINTIKQKTYYKPGGKCPSGRAGWLSYAAPSSSNCSNECYAFVKGVAIQLYGSHNFISGVTDPGYKANSLGSYNTVGTLVDTPTAQPSLSSVKGLMQKAYPGDVIQFKGGPGSYAGTAQHTAIVESVDGNGVRIYQHGNRLHVNSTYYSWSNFYNSYLDFDVYTSYNKGISLYHYKNYNSVFSSHTHSYSKVVSYSYKSYNSHTVKKQCSCGATKTETESCTFTTSGDTRKCSKCGKAGQPYGSNKVVSATNARYYIKSAKNSKYILDVAGGSSAIGTNVQMWTKNNTTAQQFLLSKNSNGTYAISNWINKGRLVGLAGWKTDNKVNIQMNDFCKNHMTNQWYLEKTSDGYYSFRNKYSNLYLDIQDGVVQSKSNVQQWKGNGSAAQKFILSQVTVADATVGGLSSKTYTGKALTPAVTVSIGNNTLTKGSGYTVSYSNNKNVGKAKVTIKGKGEYTGTITKAFSINPKGTSITKTTAAKKAFTVSWKKQTTQTTGYQIRYSTKSNMSSSKTIMVSKNSKTSQKVSSLKAKTKYYVQVRTYKTVNGTKYYSGWSSVKSVKTK